MIQKLKRILIASTLVYLAVLVGVSVFQRNFLYFPNHTYAPPEVAFANSGQKELSVRTGDGLNLTGWYALATKRPLTLVYFHGNADNLNSAAPIGLPYIAEGYGYLIVEYRGYSKLPGEPTEQGLYADARAFIKKLIEMGAKEENIVLVGHSLGTGVATQMATEFHVRGLMLIAPFLSASKMAQVRFPYLPAEYLCIDRYENFHKIPKLHIPLLIAVGGKDFVIPPSHGKDLFALGNEPKQFYFSPDSGHNNLFQANLYPVSFKWLEGLASQESTSAKDNIPAMP